MILPAHQTAASIVMATSRWSRAQLCCVAVRSVFEENGHLTTQMSRSNSMDRFGETQVAPKRVQIKNLTKTTVIPEGVSLSGISKRKVLGGPRSTLRCGGDEIIKIHFRLRSALVLLPAHQTAASIVSATAGWSRAQLCCVAPRSVFEENGHLTTQMSRSNSMDRFGETQVAPKRF